MTALSICLGWSRTESDDIFYDFSITSLVLPNQVLSYPSQTVLGLRYNPATSQGICGPKPGQREQEE